MFKNYKTYLQKLRRINNKFCYYHNGNIVQVKNLNYSWPHL